MKKIVYLIAFCLSISGCVKNNSRFTNFSTQSNSQAIETEALNNYLVVPDVIAQDYENKWGVPYTPTAKQLEYLRNNPDTSSKKNTVEVDVTNSTNLKIDTLKKKRLEQSLTWAIKNVNDKKLKLHTSSKEEEKESLRKEIDYLEDQINEINIQLSNIQQIQHAIQNKNEAEEKEKAELTIRNQRNRIYAMCQQEYETALKNARREAERRRERNSTHTEINCSESYSGRISCSENKRRVGGFWSGFAQAFNAKKEAERELNGFLDLCHARNGL